MLKIFSVLPLFFPGNGIQRGINFDPTNSDSFVSFSILITKNVLGTFQYNFRQKMSQTILPGLGKSNVGSHKNRDLGTFLKIGPLLPLFRLFCLFQTNIAIFTTINVQKCTLSIQCWDSNPQPSENEFPPITT